MLNPLKSRFLIQKITFVLLIVSSIAIAYLLIVVNPVGNVNSFLAANFALFVFLACLTYNIVELYVSFIKKEIMSIDQSINKLLQCSMLSLNLIALLSIYHTSNLNWITFMVWLSILFSTQYYAKSF
jgi:hypothetical protein